METIRFDEPVGAVGHVMIVNLQPDMPELYVKLQLGPAKVLGRSFHYSCPKIRKDRES